MEGLNWTLSLPALKDSQLKTAELFICFPSFVRSCIKNAGWRNEKHPCVGAYNYPNPKVLGKAGYILNPYLLREPFAYVGKSRYPNSRSLLETWVLPLLSFDGGFMSQFLLSR